MATTGNAQRDKKEEKIASERRRTLAMTMGGSKSKRRPRTDGNNDGVSCSKLALA